MATKRVKYESEFIMRASPAILYQFLTQPDRLTRWFCEACDVTEDRYVFEWAGDEEVAYLIDDIEEERVRYKWEDTQNNNEYFEFRIHVSGVTGETILTIIDYCDDNEVRDQKSVWAARVLDLKRAMGC